MSASLRALAADLIGHDPYAPVRPSVLTAARQARPGNVVAASRNGEPVAVVRLSDGRWFVVPDTCPHDGGLLSDGFVEDGRLVCARHGWEFDVETGQCSGRSVCIESTPIGAPVRDRTDGA